MLAACVRAQLTAFCFAPPLLQDYTAWAGNAIQLDRAHQGQHAPATLHKTEEGVLRMLGFAEHVYHHHDQLTLRMLLDGNLLAAYASFGIDIRCVRAARGCHVDAADSLLHHAPLQAEQGVHCGC